MTEQEYTEKVAEIMGGDVVSEKKPSGEVFWGVELIPMGAETSELRPVVYTKIPYMQGMSVEETAKAMTELAKAREHMTMASVEFIKDYEKVKDRLRARLQMLGSDPEVFRSAAEFGLDDMVIVPYVEITMENGTASMKVRKGWAEAWGTTEDEVISLAMAQTKKECVMKDMLDLMKEDAEKYRDELDEDVIRMIENREVLDLPEMIVCTRENRTQGAIAGILLRDELMAHFGTGYTLLPSSVHESIVINRSDNEEGFLSEMVQMVNGKCVEPHEILGTRAYLIS